MRSKLFHRSKCLVLAAASVCAIGVHAEDCKQISDAAKRLECFDRAANDKQAESQPVSEEAAIQAAVRHSLKDPASAQFGPLTVVAPGHACQSVNARNSYGGYTGTRQAIMARIDGQWNLLAVQDMTLDRCLYMIEQIKKRIR